MPSRSSKGAKGTQKKVSAKMATIYRLKALEAGGYILDWDFEDDDDEDKKLIFYVTLLNKVELEMTAWQTSAFHLGCVSGYANFAKKPELITTVAMRGFRRGDNSINRSR